MQREHENLEDHGMCLSGEEDYMLSIKVDRPRKLGLWEYIETIQEDAV